MKGALIQLGFHAALIINVLAYVGVLHLAIPILLLSLAIAYTLVFIALCYTSRLLATSFVSAPLIAIKLQLKFGSALASYAARGFKPMFPEWTLAFELTVSMMRYVFQGYGRTIVYENTQRIRDPAKLLGQMTLKSNCSKHNTVPEQLVVNDMEHVWLRDPEKKPHRVVVIHFQGGGYCLADPLQHVEMANHTHSELKRILKDQYQLNVSVDVLLANYRKAPDFLYPTAVNDCFDMYKYVLGYENVTPDHVVFSGDSAGGEMSLSNCMRLRKEAPELQPVAVLCYSPVVDFSETTDRDEKTPYCVLVTNFLDHCIPMYLSNVTDPEERRLASPINNSLRGLPPTFLQWGSLERFYSQGLRFKAKASAEGVTNMEFDVLENMVHDVVMLPAAVSPSTVKAIQNGCAFAAKHLSPVLRASGSTDPEPEP